jgi:hypothetical protein
VASTTLARSILSAGNVTIPVPVAAALLSALTDDDVPHTLWYAVGFSGDEAFTVATASKAKAKLIAANTSDAVLQRRLFECPRTQAVAMAAMLNAQAVTDPDLLIDMHELVWSDRYLASEYGVAREKIAYVVPLDYQVRFLAELSPDRAYPAELVARRIGAALADGEMYPLDTVDQIFARFGPRQANAARGFVVAVSRALVMKSDPSDVVDRLRAIEARLDPSVADEIILETAAAARVVDAELLEMHLARIETPEQFAEYQRTCIDSAYTGPIAQAPRSLSTRDKTCTVEALERLAATFPGALRGYLEDLVVEQHDTGSVIDIALGTGRCDLAHVLLDRSATRSNSTNRTPLTPAQFHRAVEAFRDGTFIGSPHVRPQLDAVGAARAIPVGADTNDVAAMLQLVDHPGVCLAKVISGEDDSIEYAPTSNGFARLLSTLNEQQRLYVVTASLRVWAQRSHPDSTTPLADDLAERINAAVDSVPARSVAENPHGVWYIAHAFNGAFGADSDRWLSAVGMVQRATVCLSKVVSAAKRL